jgi:hypothetical protein
MPGREASIADRKGPDEAPGVSAQAVLRERSAKGSVKAQVKAAFAHPLGTKPYLTNGFFAR